ncbi:MAG: O-antigen ligase family protein [Oscillospiraceae bacterium]|nr:O-antigen ligase family protein [Oscillospiraceae bacterium]
MEQIYESAPGSGIFNQQKYRQKLIILGLLTIALITVSSILLYWGYDSIPLKITYAMAGTFLAGTIIMMAQNNERFRMDLDQGLLFIYLGWYVISCLIMTVKHHGDWVSYNNGALLDTLICVAICYPIGRALAKGEGGKVFLGISHILILAWAVIMIITLIAIFQGNTLRLPNGRSFRMQGSSLLLNCNRNTTGLWSMVFFIGSVCMIIHCKRALWKGIYIISSVVNYFILALSASRTSQLSTALAVLGIVGIMLWVKLPSGIKSFKRFMIAGCAGLLSAILIWVMRSPVFWLLHLTTGGVQTAEARDFMNTGAKFLNGRIEVWDYFLKGWTSSIQVFLTGVTPASCTSLISEMSNGRWSTYTHNQFLEIGVDTGLIGLGIFGFWFIRVIIQCWKLYFKEKNKTYRLLIPWFIALLMVSNMFEATLLFYRFMTAYLFFILCGMMSVPSSELKSDTQTG